jgi:hypothetical protein
VAARGGGRHALTLAGHDGAKASKKARNFLRAF